jgi:hypothetical protein
VRAVLCCAVYVCALCTHERVLTCLRVCVRVCVHVCACLVKQLPLLGNGCWHGEGAGLAEIIAGLLLLLDVVGREFDS